MMVGDRLFTLTARGAIKAGVRVLPLVPDALLGALKDDLDRYAARYAELADEEWCRCHELQPTLKASGQ